MCEFRIWREKEKRHRKTNLPNRSHPVCTASFGTFCGNSSNILDIFAKKTSWNHVLYLPQHHFHTSCLSVVPLIAGRCRPAKFRPRDARCRFFRFLIDWLLTRSARLFERIRYKRCTYDRENAVVSIPCICWLLVHMKFGIRSLLR